MSLHPPGSIGAIGAIGERAAPKPATLVMQVVFGGVVVSRAHTRRPRVHRLEVSKPRGGTKEIRL